MSEQLSWKSVVTISATLFVSDEGTRVPLTTNLTYMLCMVREMILLVNARQWALLSVNYRVLNILGML